MDKKDVKIETVSINDTNQQETEKCSKCEELSTQIQELNDKYLRTAAELENVRRRATLDAESRARNRAMGVAEKILPVMDAINAALKHTPNDPGIQSMARAMDAAFAQIGITKIDSVGEILNPQFHNAIQVVDAPTDCDTPPKPNTIISEMQTGYMFGDTVLRTAMVIVCK